MWKANVNTTTLLIFLDSFFPKTETNTRCLLWRQNNPEVNYSHNSDLRGEECFKISLYGAENWALRKVDQKCPEVFEMCWRKMEKITWNDDVRSEVMLYREKNKGISYVLYLNKRKATWIG
jgi:hypothetical protein